MNDRAPMLIALGGNAMTSADGRATPDDQRRAVTVAMEPVADLVAAGSAVVISHGNGPQVGNLLLKNQLAADVVPAVPLDWCGAQTQGTIGVLILNALGAALARRGCPAGVAAVVSRTRVDPGDPALADPVKPIGRYFPEAAAREFIARGQTWRGYGTRGWRRVVASPEPVEMLDAAPVAALLAAGYVVVASGGGGVPVVREEGGGLRGVEAVIDKDLAAALLARTVGARTLVIATDVEHVMVDHDTPRARPIGRTCPAELRRHAAAGHFASGSMGPKVAAAVRFVEGGGCRAVITSLERIGEGAAGHAGTVVEPAVRDRRAGEPGGG